VELLVVLAILGVLAGLLLPGLARAKHRARRVACMSQQRQIGLAWTLYLGDHQDRFPDRRDLKLSLAEGYRPWTNWPMSDPRAGWAARVLSGQLPGLQVWQCPSLAHLPIREAAQARQSPGVVSNGVAVTYWMWRFDRTNEPVALDNFWGKSVGQLLLDLERAGNPMLSAPHRPDTVELLVDVYFPGTVAALPAELRGRAAHPGGMNRLYLDTHVAYGRDARLRD
jgi:prepilin-type processing-associated H-X9-DG protein